MQRSAPWSTAPTLPAFAAKTRHVTFTQTPKNSSGLVIASTIRSQVSVSWFWHYQPPLWPRADTGQASLGITSPQCTTVVHDRPLLNGALLSNESCRASQSNIAATAIADWPVDTAGRGRGEGQPEGGEGKISFDIGAKIENEECLTFWMRFALTVQVLVLRERNCWFEYRMEC